MVAGKGQEIRPGDTWTERNESRCRLGEGVPAASRGHAGAKGYVATKTIHLEILKSTRWSPQISYGSLFEDAPTWKPSPRPTRLQCGLQRVFRRGTRILPKSELAAAHLPASVLQTADVTHGKWNCEPCHVTLPVVSTPTSTPRRRHSNQCHSARPPTLRSSPNPAWSSSSFHSFPPKQDQPPPAPTRFLPGGG